MKFREGILLCLLLAACESNVRVVDGDTIKINETTYRLLGIDAPELKQRCSIDGAQWACGIASKDHLSQLVGGGALRCSGNDRDRYGRTLAYCYRDGENINRSMVADGWAVNYRTDTDYLSEQQSAKQNRLGIWRGNFEMPWDYRHRMR